VDVKAMVDIAAAGDTVVIPAGNVPWGQTLNVTKPITLIGQTTVSYTNETANDQTIILDEVAPRAALIHADVNAGDMNVEPTAPLLVIKGITFRGSPNATTSSPNGVLQLSGKCPAVRVTNCHFDGLHSIGLYTFGWLYGVMDNCLSTQVHAGVTHTMGMHSYTGADHGNGSWAEDPHWGSYKFFFTENCVIKNLSKVGGSMDAKRGARYVVRYSKIYDCQFLQTHGTEGDPDRGCRAIEYYNNICNRSTGGPGSPGGLRSGSVLFHDNNYTGISLGTAHLSLVAYRTIVNFQPWGLAGGANGWDENDVHGVYASGNTLTASVVGSGSASFDVQGDQSAYNSGGYSVRNTRTGLGSFIQSASYSAPTNQTHIVCGYNTAWPTAEVAFLQGDPWQIARVHRVLDQTGTGTTNLISSSSPPTPLAGAKSEISYAWNNKQSNGSSVTIQSGAPVNPTFVEGRDYINAAPPFVYKPYAYPHPLTLN
jgi:hypothetical protein